MVVCGWDILISMLCILTAWISVEQKAVKTESVY